MQNGSTDMSDTRKAQAPPKKESILELQKLMDATVRVKCVGGRELQGILRGYDELVNLVLDDCDEFLRGENDGCMISVVTEDSSDTV
jgi:small nuclear ribonucleoprotein (snRNP)-like protein